jgi:hypothetical protein
VVGNRTGLTSPVLLYPVREGLCPCCGRTQPIWTPAAILDAMRQWKRTTGRAPVVADWKPAPKGFPSVDQVLYVFGSFAVARDVAGLKKPKRRSVAA